MDTAVEAALCVHRSDGSIMKFVEYDTGLYYHDASVAQPTNSSAAITDYSFVSTINENEKLFHHRKIEGADKARALYQKIGCLSQKFFEHLLINNLIWNCPVTVDDAKCAVLIYGPDVAALKGKVTKGPSVHVPTFVPVQLPAPILEHHHNVTLCMDIFYLQGLPFFCMISCEIQFRMVAPVTNCSKTTLLREAAAVLNLYQSREFSIPDIHADMEAKCIRNDVLPLQLDIPAADDHVGEVEHSVRTMKEHTRTTIHGLPFKHLPKLMVKELVFNSAKALNQFPAQNGISNTLSPLTILTGRPNPDYNDLKLEFGSYVQVFEDNNPMNTTASQNTGAIALNPTGNARGDYFFMSLTTGHHLLRHQWTLIPMTDAVIAHVD